MFNEFQIENLIGDIQSVDSLNLVNYQIDEKVYLFYITSDDDVFSYFDVIMQIFLRHDLITLSALEHENFMVFKTVTFKRFGAN